jgi:hypothetical protein
MRQESAATAGHARRIRKANEETGKKSWKSRPRSRMDVESATAIGEYRAHVAVQFREGQPVGSRNAVAQPKGG